MKAMFKIGFANKPCSLSKNEGLALTGAYMTAAVKCASPHNEPNPFEISNCSQHLLAEVQVLEQTIQVILTLGKVAFDAYCKLFRIERLAFTHGACYRVDDQKTLLASYHPSSEILVQGS
nr:uracil-DNA glycosylase family protein [Candidatus Nitrososphaera evergladensis]